MRSSNVKPEEVRSVFVLIHQEGDRTYVEGGVDGSSDMHLWSVVGILVNQEILRQIKVGQDKGRKFLKLLRRKETVFDDRCGFIITWDRSLTSEAEDGA